MKVQYKNYCFDLSKPIDISTPLHTGENQINCYYAPPFRTEPVIMGNFIGDTEQGGLLNYKNVFLNPHGNGTHTECVGHICNKKVTINQTLQRFHFLAQLLTVTPSQLENGDVMISPDEITGKLENDIEAIVIRTLPNSVEKLTQRYSGTNPPYMHVTVAELFREKNIKHLLIDLPSLDKEEDNGKLLAHHAFFHHPENTRYNATITELIFVPDTIEDGKYLLNLQIASFELDVAPSKPVLYRCEVAELK
ncbi:MAG: cyclase family protein [Chitinophagales bacterium]